MAHTISLPEAVLDDVAHQIGRHIISLAPFDEALQQPGEFELAETLEMYMLRADAVTSYYGADIAYLAMPLALLHHQVKFNGEAIAFARSTKPSNIDDSSIIEEFTLSPLARQIDGMIGWLDDQYHISGDPEVRLLIAPAYQLHALWLSNDETSLDQVVVVDAPSDYTELQPARWYDAQGLLEVLHRQVPALGVL